MMVGGYNKNMDMCIAITIAKDNYRKRRRSQVEKLIDHTFKHYFQKDPEAFWINENGQRRSRSVHYGDEFRFRKAREEAEKNPVPVEQVIRYCNEFLTGIGVSPVANPRMDLKMMDLGKISYSDIKKEFCLLDERDIVWLKFSQTGHVGVVAQGNDINHDIPPSAAAYNYKDRAHRWVYTTAGIIIHRLGMRWDTSFVLVFPLMLNKSHYNRHEIETGIGNYLIDKGVPILDYYSHNY